MLKIIQSYFKKLQKENAFVASLERQLEHPSKTKLRFYKLVIFSYHKKALASDDIKNGLISQMPLLLIANCYIPLEKTPEINSLKLVVMILLGGVTLSLDVPIF